ncbi:MAG TPA: [Fe-Fe] hydrogenase large subunit C-terminal domain-containing protein [Salinivirgaceae bacterium]|nr:[Fe-Fe] hydrogenase large subunit C-terminal domain-containing protein [Salinivirgaceae bacterium]
MSEQQFHHALTVNPEKCFGCTHCMSICPTEAIRVRNGKALIYEHKCIDCGMCYRVCPAKAIEVEQDDFQTIFNFERRVILYPSVLTGQFPNEINTPQIIAALKHLGFTDVFEVEHGSDFLTQTIQDYIQQNTDRKPLISSFCPAIVRLIQVKFPSLVENIIHIKPPLDIAAIYYRKKLEEEGITPQKIGIFYITPCAAKIAAVKSPVGEERSSIDGVINLDFIYNLILKTIKANPKMTVSQEELPTLRHQSIRWALTNGEADRFEGRCLAIDEVHNAMEFLEKLENDEIPPVDFIEIRACDESCPGGILNVENRFIVVDRLKKRAKQQKNFLLEYKFENALMNYSSFLKENCTISDIKPRSMLAMDSDTNKALSKLERVRELMCFLPGIDCGVCGAPSCRVLAEDIVGKKAQLSDCVFIRTKMQTNKSLGNKISYNITKKIWGEHCMDKNCYRKGAKNEHQTPPSNEL